MQGHGGLDGFQPVGDADRRAREPIHGIVDSKASAKGSVDGAGNGRARSDRNGGFVRRQKREALGLIVFVRERFGAIFAAWRNRLRLWLGAVEMRAKAERAWLRNPFDPNVHGLGSAVRIRIFKVAAKPRRGTAFRVGRRPFGRPRRDGKTWCQTTGRGRQHEHGNTSRGQIVGYVCRIEDENRSGGGQFQKALGTILTVNPSRPISRCFTKSFGQHNISGLASADHDATGRSRDYRRGYEWIGAAQCDLAG